MRAQALREGKELYMAVPRLRAERCFLRLDPVALAGRAREAASIAGAARYGRPVLPREMPRVDLIVAGSVAVGRDGARAGKGGGFSDLEWGLLVELGLVGEWTTVVTTVHPLQIVRARVPMLPHDVPLDIIAAPERVIRCRPRRARPPGVLWDALPPGKIEEVPLLAALARARSARTSPRRRR